MRVCRMARRLDLDPGAPLSLPPAPEQGGAPVVVLVGALNRGSAEAVRYARSIAGPLVAVHVDLDGSGAEAFRQHWNQTLPQVRLEVLPSTYRSLVNPVTSFVQRFEAEHSKDPASFCTVVLPVYVTRRPWEKLLHNQSALNLRRALRNGGTRVVTTVGFYL